MCDGYWIVVCAGTNGSVVDGQISGRIVSFGWRDVSVDDRLDEVVKRSTLVSDVVVWNLRLRLISLSARVEGVFRLWIFWAR